MVESLTGYDGYGLERSCDDAHDWFLARTPAPGVEVLQARFCGHAYDTHRHDTYAIGVTDAGSQVFDYRGATHASKAGQVIVLHPDEAHNGRSGSSDGFAYRMIYLEPSLISDAVRAVCGRPTPLPFVADPVTHNEGLARAVSTMCACSGDPLAPDSALLDVAVGLLHGAGTEPATAPQARVNEPALRRVRDLLQTEFHRPVRSEELETVSGLSRFELARQFRCMYATSPYRYLLMRRLDAARRMIDASEPLAQIAHATGFADQAHFTRHFRTAYGITPARHRALQSVHAQS